MAVTLETGGLCDMKESLDMKETLESGGIQGMIGTLGMQGV